MLTVTGDKKITIVSGVHTLYAPVSYPPWPYIPVTSVFNNSRMSLKIKIIQNIQQTTLQMLWFSFQQPVAELKRCAILRTKCHGGIKQKEENKKKFRKLALSLMFLEDYMTRRLDVSSTATEVPKASLGYITKPLTSFKTHNVFVR